MTIYYYTIVGLETHKNCNKVNTSKIDSLC